MANMTDGFENELLDAICSTTQYTSPVTTYVALFTSDPTDVGTVTSEVSGGSYARTSLSAKFTAAAGTGGSVSNTTAIVFPTATASWGTITHIGIMESGTATTADMIMWGLLTNPIAIPDTGVFEFLVGDLTVTLA